MDVHRLRQLYLLQLRTGLITTCAFYHKCCNLEEKKP